MFFLSETFSRVSFFFYFRKQMKAASSKGKQMKGLAAEEKRGPAGLCSSSEYGFKVALGTNEHQGNLTYDCKVTGLRDTVCDLALSMPERRAATRKQGAWRRRRPRNEASMRSCDCPPTRSAIAAFCWLKRSRMVDRPARVVARHYGQAATRRAGHLSARIKGERLGYAPTKTCSGRMLQSSLERL